MKFNFHHSMCPADQYAPLAQHAEALGFDGIAIPDSIFYPQEAESAYPYNEDGSRQFLDGVPFIEPMILVAHMAAVTSTIRFTTAVQKLAVHKPVMAAKAFASLAVITGNRFVPGVGISPWKEDFAATDTPWERRGRRLDECIAIIRGLMDGRYFSFDGDIFQIPALKLCPVPTEPLPILIGGHSDAALRRAARLGDGWIGAGGPLDNIRSMIERVHALREEYGRTHLPFEIHTNSELAYSADGIAQLSEAGVTHVTVAFRNVYAREPDTMTLDEKRSQLDDYADHVMGAG